MDITLVIVTLFSLALALGMGVLLWRLLQENRLRADARVAALVEGFAQRTPTATSASSITDARGAAREGDAEAPAFALRDSEPWAVDRRAAPDRDETAGAPQHADASAHEQAPGSAPALEAVHLGASEKDWLLEFPSAARTEARLNGAAFERTRAGAESAGGSRVDDARVGEDWDDVDVDADDAADGLSIAHAAWPDARRAEPAPARQARLHDWRDVSEPRLASAPAVAPGSVAASASSSTSAALSGPAPTMPPRTGRDRASDDPQSADLPLASDSARELFGQVAQADQATQTNRFTQVAVGVALLMVLMLAIWTVSRLAIAAAQPAAAPRTAAAGAGAGAPGAAGSAVNGGVNGGVATPAAAQPLELLALRPARNAGTLTINGLVRNPSTGVRQERLTAVVFFFNQRGEFLTSARAPLDFRTLAPGDESPFQVTLNTPAGVGRYRVSFRYDEGGIVSHVDRRQPAAAQGLPQAGS